MIELILSLTLLLGISSIIYLISHRTNFPYSILLVIAGIFIMPLLHLDSFDFLGSFSLTPDILLYIFLPILVFEGGFNINYKDLLRNFYEIFSLAFFGLLISTFTIGGLIYYIFPLFDFDIPFIVALLFGALISATDTISVLNIFKTLGAPKRLVTVFEGESLFNDGAAIALFLVILGVILDFSNASSAGFSQNDIYAGILLFLSMNIGGIVFGLITGYVFSKLIHLIKNTEDIEVLLTIILAQLTFILSAIISNHLDIGSYHLEVSGIIATTTAGLVMGNYGRYKISPKVIKHMEQFWATMVFILNSLVFILLGLTLHNTQVDLFSGVLYLVFVTYIILFLARLLSVIIPINIFKGLKLINNFPLSWQFVLGVGAPRGAVAFVLILMIPDNLTLESWVFDFSIKDFLIVLTISSIILTLFINVLGVGSLVRKLGLNKMRPLEKLELNIAKIIINTDNIERLDFLKKRGAISTRGYKNRLRFLNRKIMRLQAKNLKFLDKDEFLVSRAISMYALGIEKKYLIGMLKHKEIDENNFKYILNRIDEKIHDLNVAKLEIVHLRDDYENNIFEDFVDFFRDKSSTDKYIIKRSLKMAYYRVILELKDLSRYDLGFSFEYIDDTIQIFELGYKKINISKNNIYLRYSGLERKLVSRYILKYSEETLLTLDRKGMISDKLYDRYIDDMSREVI